MALHHAANLYKLRIEAKEKASLADQARVKVHLKLRGKNTDSSPVCRIKKQKQ
jgi:hypothetical protein